MHVLLKVREHSFHTILIGFADDREMTELQLAFLAFLCQDVVFESMLSLQFSRGGSFETLCSPGIGLHFWHDSSIIFNNFRTAKVAKFAGKERDQMLFHEIFFFTPKLEANKQFYCDTLGFEKTSESETSFSFRAGKSIVHFSQKKDIPIYHYAFNIPENQQLNALRWIKERTTILPTGKEEIIDFSNWNAHAIYFTDPAGNIVEFIARHDLPNASEVPFSIESVIELSEIGMVNSNAPATYRQLQRDLGIQPYRQHSDRFAAMGDEHGLFIVVPDDRDWYPTEIPSEMADFRVRGSLDGHVFSFVYQNGRVDADLR